MTIEPFQDTPPADDTLTDYDRDHVKLYSRLLDAVTDGADWREVVQVLFGIDASVEASRARLVYDAHLARAEWMTQAGYRHLLRGGPG